MRRTTIISMVLALCLSIAPPPATAATMIVTKDVVYVMRDGQPLTLDVYAPSEGESHPVVVAIHGGGWHRDDKTQWRKVAPDLVDAGFVVVAIDYRLAERGAPTYRHAPLDVRRAIRWVRENAGSFSADKDDISLLGSSAGGHLALLAGQRHGYPKVRAVAAWSPPVNLKGLAKRGVLRFAIRKFLGCSLKACPKRYKTMSPLFNVTQSDPRTFLANSTEELIPYFQIRLMRERLDRRGVENTLRKVQGSAHGQKLAPAVLDDTIAFLAASD